MGCMLIFHLKSVISLCVYVFGERKSGDSKSVFKTGILIYIFCLLRSKIRENFMFRIELISYEYNFKL